VALVVQHKNKEIKIDDKEISSLMKKLDLSKDEAIQLYLDDLDTTHKYTPNAEAEALYQKAKANGVQRKMCSTGVIAKSTKKRAPRPLDVDKADIISAIKDFLDTAGYDNVEVTNPVKYVEFDLGDGHYTVNLIRKNKNLAAKKAKQK
jgi:hypothetical protein